MTRKLLTVAALALSFALPTTATLAKDAGPGLDAATPAHTLKKRMKHHRKKAAAAAEAPAK